MSQEAMLIWPPEFFSDHIHDNKGDIWQLGLLFYELITFNELFKAKVQRQLLNQMAEVDMRFNWIPDIFSPFKDIIKRMLTVDKDERCSLD